MSYYKTNRLGNKLDAAALQKMAELQEGQGDGRISKADAKELHDKIYDGGQRTEVEDRTVDKIYRDGNFTKAGRDEFEHLNRSAGQKLAHKAPKAEDTKPGAGLASQLAIRTQQKG